ncbi:MAG: nickel pincer cofactor biosynthesis protein LarC [Desulfobulbaceae bacterium]|nr:nickel pincer cofactor biosynthesis protein LarC [Desulfobulbaceae bacterium]
MRKKIAYADCFSGASGDMLLGALLDVGLNQEVVGDAVAAVGIEGYALKVEPKVSSGIKGTRLTVEVDDPQPHRSWKDIRLMLEQSRLDAPVREKAIAVFSLLAKAEAHVHGCSPEDVHFHEVGAVDSIADIVGVSAGLVHLGVDRLIASSLPMPRGWVSCAHGSLPLPAPAVCEILKGVPVYGVDLEEELVTPTGAALLKGLASDFGPFPSMIIKDVGYGAGSRKLSDGRPNLLRLVIGRETEVEEAQEVEIVETHLDDWSPEGFPYLCELLFEKGALDVVLIPMQMKKGRPGFLLRVICDPAHGLEVKRTILAETTTIGLHYRKENRWTLPRVSGTVPSPWGPLMVKKVTTPDGDVLYPEYEDCRRVAKENSIPLKEVYREVARFEPDEMKE